MASLSFYPQFETNLMSNRSVIELLLQLVSAKAHGKNYIKVKAHLVAIFCVIIYKSISKHQFEAFPPGHVLYPYLKIDDYAKDGGPGEVRLLCCFYHEPLRT